jgi:hypothetical protein
LIRFYKPDVDYWELFDNQKDPFELKSFYGDPEYAQVTKDLKAELDKLRKDLKVPPADQEEAWYFGGKRPGQQGKKGQGQGAGKKAAPAEGTTPAK